MQFQTSDGWARKQGVRTVNRKEKRQPRGATFKWTNNIPLVSRLWNLRKGNAMDEETAEDVSIWQRPGWSFAEVKPSYSRAIATTWDAEMCRAH